MSNLSINDDKKNLNNDNLKSLQGNMANDFKYSSKKYLSERANEGDIGYVIEDGSVLVRDGVERIPAGYLSDCKDLREVSLPRSIECVENGAFANCPKLKKVVIRAVSDDVLGNFSLPEASEYASFPGYLMNIIRYNELG